MKRYFCTYFDQNFIYQGLALYQSLRQHAGDFTLWILCFDEVVYELLGRLDLPNLQRIRLADFEAAYPELVDVKADRSMVEYYWTTTPFLPRYILNFQPQVDLITYLDADIFFYGDLQVIYDELGSGSIYIIPHRFFPNDSIRARAAEDDAGIYNVGLIVFRRDFTAFSCLERWASQTLKWCFNRIEGGQLGDQKYLDDWPQSFSGVVISQNLGVGLGGWNFFLHQFNQRNGSLYVDNIPVIMLHINTVRLVNPYFFSADSNWPLRPIYWPYARSLRYAIDCVGRVAADFQFNYQPWPLWRWGLKWLRGGIFKIR